MYHTPATVATRRGETGRHSRNAVLAVCAEACTPYVITNRYTHTNINVRLICYDALMEVAKHALLPVALALAILGAAFVIGETYWIDRRPDMNMLGTALGQPCAYSQLSYDEGDTKDMVCFFYTDSVAGTYPPAGPGVWIDAPLLAAEQDRIPALGDLRRLGDVARYEDAANAFSFDYPTSWYVIDASEGATSTVRLLISPNDGGEDSMTLTRVCGADSAPMAKAELALTNNSFSHEFIVRKESLTSGSPSEDVFAIVPRYALPDADPTRRNVWFEQGHGCYAEIDQTVGRYPTIDAGTFVVLATLNVNLDE